MNKNTDKELLRDKLLTVLTTEKPSHGLNELRETGVMEIIIPDMMPTYNTWQTIHHHSFVWDHILRVVDKVPNKPLLRLAALLHDIGKPETLTVGENGATHFYGHEAVSAKMAETAMRDLKFSDEDIHYVKTLVKEHMRLGNYANSNPTRRALRRLLRDVGNDYFDDFLELCHADKTSCAEESQREDLASRVRAMLADMRK